MSCVSQVALLGLIVLGTVCTASAPSGQRVTREQFAERWPFTVDEGRVECIDGDSVVFHTGANTYALNGHANARAVDRGWQPAEPIWRENPSIPGARINVQPITRIGLDQCR